MEKQLTEKEISELKIKADKWDALGKKIAACYVTEDGDVNEDGEDGEDLVTIGEMAASAYGWL